MNGDSAEDDDEDAGIFAFHLYLDSLEPAARDRLIEKIDAPAQRDIDAATSKVRAARAALASAEAALERAIADASAAKRRARKSVLAMPPEEAPAEPPEAAASAAPSHPAVRSSSLAQSSLAQSSLAQALLPLHPHTAEAVAALDELVRRRRLAASYHPSSAEVEAEHREAMAAVKRNGGRPLRIPADPSSSRPSAPTEAYATLLEEGRLRIIHHLNGLRSTCSPRAGAVLGGTLLDVGSYPFEMIPSGDEADDKCTSGWSTLLRADDGTVCRLRLYECSQTDIISNLHPGRHLTILHVWLTREHAASSSGFPFIRVDDMATVHFDVRPHEVLKAIGGLVAAAASDTTGRDDGAVIRLASGRKDAGSNAFRSGDVGLAYNEYSNGLEQLLLTPNVPLRPNLCLDMEGSAAVTSGGVPASSPILLRSDSDEAIALTISLLTNRSIAALRLERPIRALADADAASSLLQQQATGSSSTSSQKVAFRRAKALIALGATHLAIEALRPHVATDADLARLSRDAAGYAQTMTKRVIGARVVLPSSSPADGSGSTSATSRYLGPMALRRCSGDTNSGGTSSTPACINWIALKSIHEGELLIVEPAAALTDESSSLTLSSVVARMLGRESDESELRELLCCLVDADGGDEEEEEALAAEVAAAEENWVREVAAVRRRTESARCLAFSRSSGLDPAIASRIESLVSKLQHGVYTRHHGEQSRCGVALFPLSSLFMHSCCPNAIVAGYDSKSKSLITRALRRIQPNEPITVAYMELSSGFIGATRRAHLWTNYHFECGCVVCAAPKGSTHYERERLELSLICPFTAASNKTSKRSSPTNETEEDEDEDGHLLLPTNPYDTSSDYTCRHPGCRGALSAAEAAAAVESVHTRFEALRTPFELGSFQPGCHAARVAEKHARSVLGRAHHEWGLWVAAASALATGASDTELLMLAVNKRRGMKPVAHREGEEDVTLQIHSAIAYGLEGRASFDALRYAFHLDRIASGGLIEEFVERWIPVTAQKVRAAAVAAVRGEGGVERGVQAADGRPQRRSAEEAAAAAPTTMAAVADRRTPSEVARSCGMAERRLREWAHTRRQQKQEEEEEESGAFAYAGFDPSAAVPSTISLHQVWLIENVLTSTECDTVLSAVKTAAIQRGGWEINRHGKYPTTDMPLTEVPQVEPLLRSAIFQRVLLPLCQYYLPSYFLPECLAFNDLFFVKYSAEEGCQRDLNMHTDGSLFSFNLLLNAPTEFDGGGTYFEPTKLTVKPSQRGMAVGHSGQVRHSGLAITRGERYLIVGFIGCMPHPYAMRGEGWQREAERKGFLKFGQAAWRREEEEGRRRSEPKLVNEQQQPQKEEAVVVAQPMRYVPVD